MTEQEFLDGIEGAHCYIEEEDGVCSSISDNINYDARKLFSFLFKPRGGKKIGGRNLGIDDFAYMWLGKTETFENKKRRHLFLDMFAEICLSEKLYMKDFAWVNKEEKEE